MGHDGFARAIRPVHTMVDGDTLFVMANGSEESDLSFLGTLAAKAVEKAIVEAVRKAENLGDDILTYSQIDSGKLKHGLDIF